MISVEAKKILLFSWLKGKLKNEVFSLGKCGGTLKLSDKTLELKFVLPDSSRNTVVEMANQVKELSQVLSEFLSEKDEMFAKWMKEIEFIQENIVGGSFQIDKDLREYWFDLFRKGLSPAQALKKAHQEIK